MTECIFCQIATGKIPCYKIYEYKDYLAFLDIFPKTEGHILVIPKIHIEKVWDHPEPGKYWETVTKVAQHLKQVSGEEVRALVYGFDVPHAHVHLLPGKTDKFSGQKLSDAELKEIQSRFLMKS